MALCTTTNALTVQDVVELSHEVGDPISEQEALQMVQLTANNSNNEVVTLQDLERLFAGNYEE